jgi:outer membrane protein assembly factor BamE (lipoprotein component of BamABCDE complex)
MKRAAVATLMIFASSTFGCQQFVDGGQSSSHTNALMKVQVGMNRDEVIALMGQPQRRETYGKTEFLIYQTGNRSSNEDKNFTPIAIADGRVVGWGRNYYDSTVYSKAQADVTVRNR